MYQLRKKLKRKKEMKSRIVLEVERRNMKSRILIKLNIPKEKK